MTYLVHSEDKHPRLLRKACSIGYARIMTTCSVGANDEELPTFSPRSADSQISQPLGAGCCTTCAALQYNSPAR